MEGLSGWTKHKKVQGRKHEGRLVDLHGHEGTAQVERTGLGMDRMRGMSRRRTIPIAAGGIPLDGRHGVARFGCASLDFVWSAGRGDERSLECKVWVLGTYLSGFVDSSRGIVATGYRKVQGASQDKQDG